MASTYLTRTFQSGGNRKKWTWSGWIKRSSLTSSSNGYSLFDITGGSDTYTQLNFGIDGGGGSGSATDSLMAHSYGGDVFRTTRLLRDTNGFYHIVLAVDTTQATATNRIKLYVNGELQTYSQETNFPGQNEDLGINRNAVHTIGSQGSNANYYFDGLMSHIHFCDNYQYQASEFGETDSTTGEWKIKTSPSVSYGTTGFFILKDGNSVTDQSGNSNNFTVGGGTLTKTEDSPSNVFATFNPLALWNHNGTLRIPAYSNGNLTAGYDNSSYNEVAFGNLGADKGKWYWEVKATNVTATSGNTRIGIGDIQYTNTDPQGTTSTVYYQGDGNKKVSGSASSYGATYTTGDIIGVAMDLDNNKLYFHKNGTYQNSGVPTSGSTGTGAIAIPTGDYIYTIQCEDYASSGTRVMNLNTGNGYFGTTAVSSAGANASGIGIFEYDVPTGYTALSTKGLNL